MLQRKWCLINVKYIFISCAMFFLFMALLYNIKFSQILTKKLCIRIFIIVSCWSIRNDKRLSLGRAGLKFVSIISCTNLRWKERKFSELFFRARICGPLQALVTRWSHLYTGDLSAEGWYLRKCSKRFPIPESNF